MNETNMKHFKTAQIAGMEGIGNVLDLFYVSEYEEEWSLERDDLKDGYSLVYAINLDADWCSEYGSIGFGVCGGGLVRSA